MKKSKSITLSFCGIILSACLQASTYYVKSAGNDNAAGTSIATAWQTITKVNTINFQPGDQILFEGGQTFVGNIYIDNNDANNASNNVVFSSYGTGKAIISATNGSGFYAYNTQGFTISNLIFEGSGLNTNTSNGVSFYTDLGGNIKLGGISIKNIEIRYFGKTGLTIGSWNGNTGYKDLLIDNVYIHHVKENGLTTYGYETQTSIGSPHFNITIKNSKVHDVTGYSDPNSHKGSGIVMGQVDKGLIENCVAYNNGSGNTHCGGPGGIWAYSCNDITIQYCESYKNSSGSGSGCDGLGFDFDGGVTNSLMQYNYSHDNDGAGYLLGQYDNARPWKNNIVRYNISENDGQTNAGGITLFKGPGTTMDGLKIYHNTIYITPSVSNSSEGAFTIINWNTGITGVEVYNNIFQTTGGVPFIIIPTGYNAYFAGNLYWSTGGSFKIDYQGTVYTNLATWRTATSNEKKGTTSTGIVADPLLTNVGTGIIVYPNSPDKLNAYKLPSNSPAINNGLNLLSLFGINSGARDFFNNSAPTGPSPDIGAYESSVITSIINNDSEYKTILYPNPVQSGNEVYLTSDKLFYSAELFTITGMSIWKSENINSRFLHISTEKFAKGTYFIRLIDNSRPPIINKLIIE